jgi:hypothetical protein
MIKSLTEIQPYADEPTMYCYTTKLKKAKKYTDFLNWDEKASGFSFFSREYALLKSLAEAGERLSNSSFLTKNLIFKTSQEIISQKHFPQMSLPITQIQIISFLDGKKDGIFSLTKKYSSQHKHSFLPTLSLKNQSSVKKSLPALQQVLIQQVRHFGQYWK